MECESNNNKKFWLIYLTFQYMLKFFCMVKVKLIAFKQCEWACIHILWIWNEYMLENISYSNRCLIKFWCISIDGEVFFIFLVCNYYYYYTLLWHKLDVKSIKNFQESLGFFNYYILQNKLTFQSTHSSMRNLENKILNRKQKTKTNLRPPPSLRALRNKWTTT